MITLFCILAVTVPGAVTICYAARLTARRELETDKDLLAYRLEVARLEDARDRRLLGSGQ